MPQRKSWANFDSNTKNKTFSTASQKPNQCRSTTLKWSHFRKPTHQSNTFHLTLTGIKLSSIPHTEIKWVWTTYSKCKSICMLTLKQEIFAPRSKTKTISTTHPTTKSISSLHWNQVIFDPPHWNQVNLDHPHKKQLNFHAHNKNKWFSPCIRVTSEFLPPAQQWLKSIRVRSPTLRSSQHHNNQLNFHDHTKNK